ncbi:hypothetical protein FJ987_16540 [Mesorhizobium sp. CU2]|uniref:hypothetical protein n=1 Tax=unclassified Mesorhizobium TaxID=325217 RepID=UPI00112DFDF2|nr:MULTISPECIES: hypothetical protein [unclassified Mesorhizobium]TPN82576.1 hypothetical protein FJ988_15595 [Mesorhizobium sp. CU3]TPO12780.1 hypothetical protein FJ987_16540 [Mesorhizobium sp. CU2]
MDEEKGYFRYTQEEILEYLISYWDLAEDFIEEIVNKKFVGDEIKIVVSPRRLYLAVESAYQDIARYKNYHQTDPFRKKLDCTKRCAFLLKWIPRLKPIQVIPDSPSFTGVNDQGFTQLSDKSHDDLELLNELFALYLFEINLSAEIKLDVGISEQKLRQLAYDLLYRDISRNGWIAILQLFKDCCHPKFVKGVPFLTKL